MFKRIFILTGVVVFSAVLVSGWLELLSGVTPAVRANPAFPSDCEPIIYDILTNTTWSGECYRVMTSAVTVQSDALLTIVPTSSAGTRVEFDPNARLQVLGGLRALGDRNRPITFTLDNITSTPPMTSWVGIMLAQNSSFSDTLQYSVIQYSRQGIHIDNAKGISILSNTFLYNGEGGSRDGAIGGLTDYSLIANNTIYSATNGILLGKSSFNDIISNTISNVDGYGVALFEDPLLLGGNNDDIISNTISGCGQGGVFVNNGNDNMMIANQISNCGQAGLLIRNGSNNAVKGNEIARSSGDGLRLDLGSGNVVFSNSIYLNAGGAISLSVQAGTRVQYNHVYSNGSGTGRQASIYVTGTPDTSINNISYNVVYDRHEDTIWYTASNGDTGSLMWNNALCSVPPAYRLRNDDNVTLDAPYTWWGTNIPTLGREYTGSVNITPWITLSLITSTATLPADGVSTSSITISLRDTAGHTVPPASTRQTNPPAPNPRQIDLTTTMGVISPRFVFVGDDGFATATLTSAPTTGTALITATAFCNYPVSIPVRFAATNLAITKTAIVTQVVPGDALAYRITYSNTSSITASDVRITDTLPAGATWLSDTAPALGWTRVQTSPVVVYTRSNALANTRESFTLMASARRAACGVPLTNVITLSTATNETNLADNAASALVEVACVDLSIAKVATPPIGTPADPVTFRITYTNNSNVTLPSFVITDTLPTDTSYVSDTSNLPMTPVPGGLVWNGSNLALNRRFSFDLRLRYTGATCSQGITLTNRVDIASTAPEMQMDNNTVTATYAIRGGMCADVVVIKNDEVGPTTPAPNAPLSSDKRDALARLLAPHGLSAHREFVRPGDLVTYTIAVVNHGVYTATQFVLTETMPLNSDYIGYDWAQLDTRTFTTSVGTLAPGAGRVYEFVVRVWPDIPGDTRNITNTICGQGAELDLNPEDNCWIEDTPVRPWELRVTKSAPQCVIPGQDFEYTIWYTNTMTGTTFTHVPLTDTLSPYVAYLGGGGWNCPSHVCTQSIPTVTAGIHSVGLLGQLDAHFPYTIEHGITNTVEITGGYRFTLFTPVYTGADLAVVKNDNVGPLPLAQQRAWDQVRSRLSSLNRVSQMSPYREFVQPGDRITYTILYVNNGLEGARHVVLTETLPVQTQYIGGGWTPVGGGLYTISLGDLGPHEGGEVHFIVQIDNAFSCRANPLRNRVSIGGDNAECDLSDNWSVDHTTISNCVPVNNVIFFPIVLRDYPPPLPNVLFSSGHYSVDEKVGAAEITVVLDRSWSQTVTVDYYTQDGTARAGNDYTATSGALVFAPGTPSKTFAVPVVDDGVYEGPETVYLWLTHARNANIVPPNPATLTIEDNPGVTCSPMPPSCAPAVWCTLPSAPSPTGMAYETSTERLYIANEGSGGDGNLRRSTSLGMPVAVNDDLPGARGVALDRGRNRLYVAGGDSLYVLEGATYARVRTIRVGAGARGVAYNPNTDLIYVTAYEDNSVWVINAETWNAVRLHNFHEPAYVAVNTVTNKVYVSNHTGGNPWGYVTVISGTSEITRVYLSADLYGLAVDEVHNRIYVASISVSRLFVIDGVTDTKHPIDILIMRSGGNQVPLRMVAVNPSVGGADTHVWLTSSSNDYLGLDKLFLLHLPGSNWPPSSPMTLRAVSVDPSPEGGLVFDPASWRVFASSANSNLVTVSQDNATLCRAPLATSAAAGNDDYYVVVLDNTNHKPGR